MRKINLLLASILAIMAILFPGCRPEDKVTLSVSAGAGLTDAITEINTYLMQQNDDLEIITNFASSGDLQNQIENGAPVDVFISAASRQMDALEKKRFIIPETRQDILGNKLVLIIHEENSLNIADFKDLLKSEVDKIAIGDPEFVPAGSYALQAMQFLNIAYEDLGQKIIVANNVRQVLNYVETKSVDAGIVYASDVISSHSVQVVATAPDQINELIVFPAAVIASSNDIETAKDYIDFLFSSEASMIFEKHGFISLAKQQGNEREIN